MAIREGAAIRIKDIASVEDTYRRITRIARINDLPGVRMVVYKQSGQNTVKVVEGVYKELKRLEWEREKRILLSFFAVNSSPANQRNFKSN